MNVFIDSTRQTRAKDEKRARIRAAAHQLFRQRGFEKTTLRAVAAEADVAVGTVFLYATSKEDLARQVFYDQLASAYERALRDVDLDATPAVALGCLYGTVLRELAAHGAVLRTLLRVVFFLTGEQYAASDAAALEIFRRLAVPIAEWQARGLVRADLQPLDVVRLTFGVHVLMTVAVAGNPELPIDMAVAQQSAGLAALFDGLTPRGAA